MPRSIKESDSNESSEEEQKPRVSRNKGIDHSSESSDSEDEAEFDSGARAGGSGEGSEKGSATKRPTVASAGPDSPQVSGDSSEEDDEDDEEERSLYEDGYASDLMGDEEDRARLEALPELERERIISERYEKRMELKKSRELRERVKEQRKKEEEEAKAKTPRGRKAKVTKTRAAVAALADEVDELSDRRTRTRTEVNEREARKSALSDLKRKRASMENRGGSLLDLSDDDGGDGDLSGSEGSSLGKATRKVRRLYRDDDEDEDQDDDSDYEVETRVSMRKSRRPARKSSAGAFFEMREYDEGEAYSDEDQHRDEEEEEEPEEEREVDLQELNKMRVARYFLEKWLIEPYFEKAVVGGFVRLAIGVHNGEQVYRVCEVVGVEPYRHAYTLGGRKTDKALRLLHGKAERVFRMDLVSNHRFIESERRSWMQAMRAADRPIPGPKAAAKRHEYVLEVINHQYTKEEIDRLIKENQTNRKTTANIAALRTKLSTELAAAENEGNHDKANHLREALNKLKEEDEARRRRRTKKVFGWTSINQKNREKNLKMDTEVGNSKQAMSLEELEDNPFLRRRCDPKVLWQTNEANDVEKQATFQSAAAAASQASSSSKQGATPPTKKRPNLAVLGNALPQRPSQPSPLTPGSVMQSLVNTPSLRINIDALTASGSQNLESSAVLVHSPPSYASKLSNDGNGADSGQLQTSNGHSSAQKGDRARKGLSLKDYLARAHGQVS